MVAHLAQSWNLFETGLVNFSEPQSILAAEPSQQALEELERIIHEKIEHEAQEKQHHQAVLRQQHDQQHQQQLQQQQQQNQFEVEVDEAEEVEMEIEQHLIRSISPSRELGNPIIFLWQLFYFFITQLSFLINQPVLQQCSSVVDVLQSIPMVVSSNPTWSNWILYVH